MRGFVDLHSHWVAGVDDGAKTTQDSLALLRALRAAGFDEVVATPHMRPGLFDNERADLERAFAATRDALSTHAGELPSLALASEHFLDDVVFERALSGEILPYPGRRAVLFELPVRRFPASLHARFFDLQRRTKLLVVVAHPERYEAVWDDHRAAQQLLDAGAVLQLDVASLDGKYGRAPRKAASRLLEEGWYQAAASDAHSARDVASVEKGIERLFELAGDEEATYLLTDGPRAILEGRSET